MKVLDEQPRTTFGGTEADALIEEARQRQRRRWWSIAIAVLLVAAASGFAVSVSSPARKPPSRSSTGGPPRVSVPPSPTQTTVYLHVNWETVTSSSGSLWLLGSYPCPAGTCIAITRSDNDGATFVRVPTPPVSRPPANGEMGLQFANREDGYFYTLTPKARLYWTGDGGKVWRPIQPPTSATWRNTSAGEGDGASSIVTTKGRAYALVAANCSNGACRSLDLASSEVTSRIWTTTPLPVGRDGQVSMTAYGSKVWLTVVRNGGGNARLFVSTDSGRNFSSLPTNGIGGLFCGVTATSAQTLWGTCDTGNGSGKVRSTDGGRSFEGFSTPGDTNSDGVFAFSDNAAIFQSPSSPNDVWLTRDGGQHFTSVSRRGQNLHFFDIAFASISTGLALEGSPSGKSSLIWRTTNGGRSWQKVKPPRLKVKR